MTFRVALRNRNVRIFILIGLVAILPSYLGCSMMWMPGRSYRGDLPTSTTEERDIAKRLKTHVMVLATEIGNRNIASYPNLEKAAVYIEKTFKAMGYEVIPQKFNVGTTEVRNIEVTVKGSMRPDEILVVGAHYDSAPICPAANDNASGCAAILEIARLFKDHKPARTVRFVAFVNEEPPHFQTQNMGSLRYAKRCKEAKETIVGMLSLETIGYYSDEPGSQNYPFPFSLFYPSVGNFIAFVGNWGSGSFVRQCIRSFRTHTQFPSEGVAAPGGLTGIGWSDHWSFFEQGYPALMVTDTAPFRYPYYHTAEDTTDKIDFERTSRVVSGLTRLIDELANPENP